MLVREKFNENVRGNKDFYRTFILSIHLLYLSPWTSLNRSPCLDQLPSRIQFSEPCNLSRVSPQQSQDSCVRTDGWKVKEVVSSSEDFVPVPGGV